MSINPSIFKAYDIRGVYPGEINEEAAYLIGRAFVAWLKIKSHKTLSFVAIGSDTRTSSPRLKKSFMKGILEQGGNVVDVGLTSTPMFYFAVHKTGADAGAMITASHNPAQYNGLKLTAAQARPIGSISGLEEIKELSAAGVFASASRPGKVKKISVLNEYVSFMANQIKGEKPVGLKIAVDNGNGMAGLILPLLFKRLKGISVFPLYFKVDCRFPHHEANPLKEKTLDDLKALIKKKNADLGIAFDGDGDRVGFLTGEGRIIRSDLVTALLAADYLKTHPGAKIAYDVRASKAVREAIIERGGRPFVSRVGHSFFKQHLWEDGVSFGGELSGHYYFKEFFNADSAIFAMMRILKILAQEKRPLAELIKPFEKYAPSGEMNFEVKDKIGAMKNLEKKFSGGTVSKVDGLTVEYKDWWFNVRPSNTEPLLRLNIEANSRELLEAKKKELSALITRH